MITKKDFAMQTVVFPYVQTGVRTVVVSLVASLFIAIAAQMSIPLWPVPITAQTLAVCIVGLVLGRKRASLAIMLYIAEAAFGLPVLAYGAALTGMSSGYIFGFLLMAYICGWYKDSGSQSSQKLCVLLVLATVLVYISGLSVLSIYMGFTYELLTVGVVPFLIGDTIKIIIILLLAQTKIFYKNV